QPVVFGHIIRVAPKFLRKLQHEFAVSVPNHHGVGRRTRIAARSAIDIRYVNSSGRRRSVRFGKQARAPRRRSFRSHVRGTQLSCGVDPEEPATACEADAADAELMLGSM